jgi:hypothetical protein
MDLYEGAFGRDFEPSPHAAGTPATARPPVLSVARLTEPAAGPDGDEPQRQIDDNVVLGYD